MATKYEGRVATKNEKLTSGLTDSSMNEVSRHVFTPSHSSPRNRRRIVLASVSVPLLVLEKV